jgi:HK97 gp10 family phage protein
MSYSLNITGVEEARKRFEKYGKDLELKLRRLVGSTAMSVSARAKINSPVDTGRLRASVTWEFTGQTMAVVGTNVEYANFQEFGFRGAVNVGAHSRTITKAFGRVLASAVTFDVQPYVREVNYKGKRYVGRAFDIVRPRFEARVQQLLDDHPL